MNDEELRQVIVSQKTSGLSLKNSKDRLFIQRNWLFDNTNKEPEKYKSKLFHMISNTKKSIRWNSRSKVIFTNQDLFFDYWGENLTDMFEYDYKTQGYDMLELQALDDIDRFGIGILHFVGYDFEKQAPIVQRVHPRQIYVPSNAMGNINGYHFFGFESTMSLTQAKSLPYKNKDIIEAYVSAYTQQIYQEEADRRTELNNIIRWDKKTGLVTLYYHYFLDEDNKTRLAVMFNDQFVDILDVPALNTRKRKFCKFPVSLYYVEDNGPYKVSLADIIEDEVRLENLLTNVMIIKTVKEGMGQTLIYDKNAFGGNVNLLTQKAIENQIVPVDRMTTEPMQNLFATVPEDQLSPDTWNMLNRANQKAREATSIDQQQQGIASPGVGTATEASILDKYSNITQAYEENILGYGRTDFARLYMAFSTYYMPKDARKFVKVGQTRGPAKRELKRSDLADVGDDFDIFIENAYKRKVDNEMELPHLKEFLTLMLSDPLTPQFKLRLLKREIAKREGLSHGILESLFGFLPEEDEAIEERNMLSHNIDVEFDSMNQDWLMKYEIYKTALPTKAKERALIACLMAYKMQLQNQANAMNPNQQGVKPESQSPNAQYIENQGQNYQMQPK